MAAILPVPWAYVTIYLLDNFLLAAILTVVLLGAATLWTGLVFLRFRQRTGSASAGFVAGTLLLWGLHHLDYLHAPRPRPAGALELLHRQPPHPGARRGRGAPGAEELQRGLRTLSTLSGDLHRRRAAGGGAPVLLERALDLAGVSGSALWSPDPAPAGRFTHGLGVSAPWVGTAPDGALARGLHDAMRSSRPVLLSECEVSSAAGSRSPLPGLVPVIGTGAPRGVAVLAGASRAPFTALDQDFLIALGQQLGAALRMRPRSRLEPGPPSWSGSRSPCPAARGPAAATLPGVARRDRPGLLGRQPFSSACYAKKPATREARLDWTRARAWSTPGFGRSAGMADDLRPPVLDDLGLAAALPRRWPPIRGAQRHATRFDTSAHPSRWAKDSELALFRVLQEALANVARHAGARSVSVELREDAGGVLLAVVDDGRGFDAAGSAAGGRMGLIGMQERMLAAGGRLVVHTAPGQGARLVASVPASGRKNGA